MQVHNVGYPSRRSWIHGAIFVMQQFSQLLWRAEKSQDPQGPAITVLHFSHVSKITVHTFKDVKVTVSPNSLEKSCLLSRLQIHVIQHHLMYNRKPTFIVSACTQFPLYYFCTLRKWAIHLILISKTHSILVVPSEISSENRHTEKEKNPMACWRHCC